MKVRPEERELHEDEVAVLRVRVVDNELGISTAVRDADTGEVCLLAAFEVMDEDHIEIAAAAMARGAVMRIIEREVAAAVLRYRLEQGQ